MLVLWGARQGDVTYNSRDFWRRNIPIGAQRIVVDASVYFDPGDQIAVSRTGEQMKVTGIEPGTLGIGGLR